MDLNQEAQDSNSELDSDSISLAASGEASSPKLASWKKVLLRSVAVVILVVALRGFTIAYLLAGQYRWSSFLFDAGIGVVIFGLLQLADSGLSWSLKRMLGDKDWRSHVAIVAIRLLFVVLLFGTFLLATVQMHPPKVACLKTPADFGVEFTQHTVTTSDGIEIDVWAMPVADPSRPVVVVTHGLGANKQNFMFVSRTIHDLNYHVVAFDFRGHGNSGGHTCTLGVKEAEDVKAAFDFAETHFADRPIYAWSTSLGAAATLRAAAEYQIFDKLVIDATFSSVENLAMETKFVYLGWLGRPAWNISRLWYWVYVREDVQRFAPLKDIAEIERPIFLIHGTQDNIIPHTETDRLSAAATSGTTMWKVDGAGHSESIRNDEYPSRILRFYDEIRS